MKAVFPGRPQAKPQACSTVLWDSCRIIAYISGNALVILRGPNDLVQTIYNDDGISLTAVAVDEISGTIATCTEDSIYIYLPFGKQEDGLRWSLKDVLTPVCRDAALTSLCWGNAGELLAGGSSLTLFAPSSMQELWTKPLASPVTCAALSHDSAFIASVGYYDRLVKVWRDRTSEDNKERFDVTYLPHPATVMALEWRKSNADDQKAEHVLYTLCSDNKLRIWASIDHHSLQMLDLWAELDLDTSIQPRIMPEVGLPTRRFVFIIDSAAFHSAIEAAAKRDLNEEREIHNLRHLTEVAERSPEVVVILDDRGNMSAWGIERIGCKARQPNDIFNLAHAEDVDLHLFESYPKQSCAQLFAFPNATADGSINILVHLFDGRVEWFSGMIDRIFDPACSAKRVKLQASWTGHAEPIKRLVRTLNGRGLLTRTYGTEVNVWSHQFQKSGDPLARQSVIKASDKILRSALLNGGNHALILHHSSISLWETRNLNSILISTSKYKVEGEPLCMMRLPQLESESYCSYVAIITSAQQGITWKITFGTDNADVNIQEFASFNLGDGQSLDFFRPVDPAGLVQSASGFFDTFANDVAVSISRTGALSTWTVKVDSADSEVHWLRTAHVETAMENPSLVSATSIRKAAVVGAQRHVLTIWDTRGSILEYTEQYNDHETIQDLDWTSTPDDQSVLAVGFPHKVLIYVQLRYDYLDAGPSWSSVRTIDVTMFTSLPIADSIWLGNGEFAIAAGHQMFLYGRQIKLPRGTIPGHGRKDSDGNTHDLFEVVTKLNGPLPVFHPQFLSQCILAGKLPLTHRILCKLYQVLKFYTNGDELDPFLEIHPEDFLPDAKVSESKIIRTDPMLSGMGTDDEDEDGPNIITEAIAIRLIEILSEKRLPQLSDQHHLHLIDVVECVGMVEKHQRSTDDHASRYLAFFRQHSLRAIHAGLPNFQVPWREIAWAYHSGSQDILIDLTSRHYQSRMLWKHARESGLFMWMTDISALRQHFETIARNEYTKTDEKNPIDCSLHYIALRKKTVLTGLWRMASWNREQNATQKFLANNFSDPRWKTAALKNAYALMGKRRFEYAAAFFLLADKLDDAVGVLSSRLGDMQLAIAVARVYEGDSGPVLKSLLQDKILPQAAREGNRWLATWAFWMLNRRDMALRALIEPLHRLLEIPGSPALESRLYLTDDPALVILYQRLRDKSLQTLRGALQLPAAAEWHLIMQSARLYDRMGCDILALDLVRNWEFLRQPSSVKVDDATKSFENDAPDPRKLLRRRSSLVVADLPTPLHKEANGSPVLAMKPPPTLIEEPSASSILDSFDF